MISDVNEQTVALTGRSRDALIEAALETARLIAANSPMVGLQAATRNAAIALNRPNLGTIEAGKMADAVVYATDPLAAPRAVRHIRAPRFKFGRRPAESQATQALRLHP